MGFRLSYRPSLAVLNIMAVLVWFAIAGGLVLFILGSAFDYGEDQAALRVHNGHVALVWAGVLLGVACVGVVLGLLVRSPVGAVVYACLAVVSLIAVLNLGTNYTRLQRDEQRLTPTYAPPTTTHCQAYSGGSNDCPGG